MEEVAADDAFTLFVCNITCLVNRKVVRVETQQAAAGSDAPVGIALAYRRPACAQFEEVSVRGEERHMAQAHNITMVSRIYVGNCCNLSRSVHLKIISRQGGLCSRTCHAWDWDS